MDEIKLRNVVDALKAPFSPGEEQYRAGPTWEKDGERWTRPLAYIDARAVFDRLDAVVGPDKWNTELERLGLGVYLCRLTIFNTVRSDVGQAGENEGEKEKSGVSDAIKRAAVQYGVGRYLYDRELPATKLERRGSDWVLPRGWRPPVHTAEPNANTVPFAASAGNPATSKQIGRIAKEMVRVGWADQAGRDYLAWTFGKRSRRELTSAEASRFIETLLALPDKADAL